MWLYFVKAAWLQYLKIMMDFFWGSSLEAQDVLWKRRSIFTASVLDEGEASPAAAAGADDRSDEDDAWDTENAVGLDGVKRVGVKRR